MSITVFAFSHQKKTRSRREHGEYVVSLASIESISVLATAAVASVFVFAFADPVNPMLNEQAELLLLILSIPAAILKWPVLACTLHSIAQVLYIVGRVQGLGFSLSYYTHWSLFCTLALTVLIGVLTLVSYMLYNGGNRRLFAPPIEILTALSLTALVSVQLFLTLGTLGMAAGYSGVGYHAGLHGWQATGYSFTVQHTVSFFFAAALFATRYEHNMLSLTVRRAVWFVVPSMLAVAWFCCVLAFEVGSHDPYSAFVDVTSFIVGVSAAAVSWAGCGVFLHV